jgi:putative transposase
MKFRSHNSCVYSLQYHLVLTTKYRKKVLNSELSEALFMKVRELLGKWDCIVIEINGEEDHIHILFEAHPTLQLSTLVNNLKTVTSRFLRKEYSEHLKKAYWGYDGLWNRSYCILSTGGATIEIIKKYIENQGKERYSSDC